eukprot:scaffold7613_cov88-Amphora_coffeaeformis.AAC.2
MRVINPTTNKCKGLCTSGARFHANPKGPTIFYDAIQSEPWYYKLKNVEEPKYHLGGDFFRDSDGTFCYGAQTYVKRMSEKYNQLFGEPSKEYYSPMEQGDQPELDVIMELGTDDIMKFQSMIGAVQWTVSLYHESGS